MATFNQLSMVTVSLFFFFSILNRKFLKQKYATCTTRTGKPQKNKEGLPPSKEDKI